MGEGLPGLYPFSYLADIHHAPPAQRHTEDRTDLVSRKESAPHIQGIKRWNHHSSEHRPHIHAHREIYTPTSERTKHACYTHTHTCMGPGALTHPEAHIPAWMSTRTHTHESTGIPSRTQRRMLRDGLGRNKHKQENAPTGSSTRTGVYTHTLIRLPVCTQTQGECTPYPPRSVHTHPPTWRAPTHTHDSCKETARAPECQEARGFVSRIIKVNGH